MTNNRFFLLLFLINILCFNICYAQIIKEKKGDSFKWVLVTDKNSGKKGAESLDGKTLVPIGNYAIVYQKMNGGFFQLLGDGIQAAFSTEGTELIPFSRGYERIVKHSNYYGVRKNGLEGACDVDGYEIVEPRYSSLYYSSIDGFNTTAEGKYKPIGITQQNDNLFAGVDYSKKGQTAPITSQNYSSTTGQETVSLFSSSSYSLSGISDKNRYRRSSLCLILLTHRDKKYAEEMERVFKNFALPARYNEHNISDLRVISVSGKQSKDDIDYLLRSNNVARRVVGRWFNRNPYTGYMDMDLVHERGGYGAFYADYQRSKNNVRGADMLRDEGIELLQSTFVLVCDMDYIDKKKGAGWAAFGLALASAAAYTMGAINQQEAYNAAQRGDYSEAQNKVNSANSWYAGSAVGTVASSVVADIGGFRVKMNAYLYKLRWNDRMTQEMYSEYWCDNQNTYSEAKERKAKFENAYFGLDFIGQYKTTSSKTILRSWSNEDEVILDVCERCVNKGMLELAKTFPVFRPRSPFYFEGDRLYSHIGSKEEVVHGKKYEIIQPYKNKYGEICYKRIGKVKAGFPWNNKNIRFDQYFDNEHKGTMFYCKKNSDELRNPGLQLREM